MKIVYPVKKRDWESKSMNFVDENNVVVGWDSEQSCCENAYFTITPELENYEEYSFDTSFFEQLTEYDDDSWQNVWRARFRLVSKDGEEAFLTLSNCHNGYYGHGFDMSAGGVRLREGIL